MQPAWYYWLIMGTALEVDTKTAERLRQLAKAQNISVEQLLEAYVPGLVPANMAQGAPGGDDKAKAFDDWAASFPADQPPLSDADVSRASIYRDR